MERPLTHKRPRAGKTPYPGSNHYEFDFQVPPTAAFLRCANERGHDLEIPSGKTYFFKRVSQTVPKVFDASVDEATADSSPKLATNRSGFKAWPTHPEPS